MFGEKELADVGGLRGNDTFHREFAERHRLVRDAAQLFHQRLHVGGFGELLGFLFDKEGLFLVGEQRRPVGFDARQPEHDELRLKCAANLRRRLVRRGRIELVEGVFGVLSPLADADDNAAFGGHGIVGDAAGALGNSHGKPSGIGGKDADIIVILPQNADHFLKPRLDGAEVI